MSERLGVEQENDKKPPSSVFELEALGILLLLEILSGHAEMF